MRTLKSVKAMQREEDGSILVFWALALAMILALIAAAVDIGMRASTQAELQSYADHVALAAAAELDGKSDSITRARAAAANMVSDTQTFGAGGTALSGAGSYTLTFFRTLPTSDTSAMTASTTDGTKAAYVRVVAAPKTVPFWFRGAVDALMGTTTANTATGATATAGFTQYACDITPLMFCLPSPTYKADQNVGAMIQLRAGGNGAAWGPGDFGFLDPSKVKVDPNGPCAGLNATKTDRCLIGAYGALTQCFAQKGVDIEPGQKVGIENSLFNVRFDIYTSVMNSYQSDPNYGPAPNVIKGIIPNGKGATCIGSNSKVSPDTKALPRDTCLVNGTCATARIGDGNWAAGRVTYWQKNYGGTADPFPTATTRYKYYLAEIAAHGGAGSTSPLLSGRSETGRPQCSTNQIPDPNRRVVVAAGIDCTANPINGSKTGVPVAEFFRLFITEPVGQDASSPPKQDIWVEVIGSAESGPGSANTGSGIFHDVVQLYR